MIGTIATEIAALQERVEYFTAQVAAAEEGTPVHMELSKELVSVKAKLAAKQTEQASIEQAGTDAGEAISTESANIIVTQGGTTATFSIYDLAANEFFGDVILDWVKTRFANQAEEYAATLQSYATENASLSARVKELESEAYQNAMEVADLQAKLSNAADQLDEKDEEVRRLTGQLEALRSKANTAAQVGADTNLSGSMKDKLMELHMQKPAVYNKRENEADKKTWLANLATTGEEVVWPKIYPGRYREVSAEEAQKFREEEQNSLDAADQAAAEEAAAAAVEAPVQSGMGVTPPAVPFPPVPGAVNGVAYSEPTGEVEAAAVTGDGEGPVTRAEFDYMKVRMDSLEFRLRQVENAPKEDWGPYNGGV